MEMDLDLDDTIGNIKRLRLDTKLTNEYIKSLSDTLKVKTSYKLLHKYNIIEMIVRLHAIRNPHISISVSEDVMIDVENNEVKVRFTTVYSDIVKEHTFLLS
jgi:hypothetical protein